MRIPTMKVKDLEGNDIIINESDFDKEKHKEITKPKPKNSKTEKE